MRVLSLLVLGAALFAATVHAQPPCPGTVPACADPAPVFVSPVTKAEFAAGAKIDFEFKTNQPTLKYAITLVDAYDPCFKVVDLTTCDPGVFKGSVNLPNKFGNEYWLSVEAVGVQKQTRHVIYVYTKSQ